MLNKYNFFVLHPVHPSMLANYRKSAHPSGAKSDPDDGGLLLDLLIRHRDWLRVLQPDTVETRQLQLLVEERRALVDERTFHSNRLTDWLKQIFPQMLRWFSDPTSAIVCEFLSRWPTLQAAQKAQSNTLRRFFKRHDPCGSKRIEQRLERITQAVVVTEDQALLEAGAMGVQRLVGAISQLRQDIGRFEQEIEKLTRAHPDFAIVDSLSGAGQALAPRILAALGTNRDRFATASELQCYSGIAPVKESSGNRSWVHWRWACPKFLRQTFHEWAACTIPRCEWARQYYQQQRLRQKSHHVAVRALAYKWLRILFRCWKDRQPYQEHIYLAALEKRSSPIQVNQIAEPAQEWKSCGGFSKPAAFSS